MITFSALLSPLGYIFVAVVTLILGCSALFIYRVFQGEKEFEKKQAKLIKNYDNILHQARKKARDILTKATDESIRVYKKADITNEKIVEELDHILQESLTKHIEQFNNTSDEFLVEYKQSLLSLKETLLHASEIKIETVQKETDQTFTDFLSSLQEGFDSFPKTLEKKMQDTLAAVDKEAEIYKKNQQEKIDTQMREIFLTTYQEILGKSITVTVQTDLILNALEKAKQEGVFTP